MVIELTKMDSFVLNQQSNHGIMDDEKKGVHVDDDGGGGGVSSSSEVSSVLSSEDSDLFEEVNSSASSSTPTSPTSSGSTSSSSGQLAAGDSGPLQDMSSLLQELPFKRGLSKHYNGKSQSFTSLANVRSLEDLAKPENPYNKKLKSCKSYGGFFERHGSSNQPGARSNHNSSSSRLMSKKASRGSCSSLCVKRNSSFIANRPPIPPPHRSTSTSNFTSQTPLFALGV